MRRFAVSLLILCCITSAHADVLYEWIFNPGSPSPPTFEFTLPGFPATWPIEVTDLTVQNGPATCSESPMETCISELAMTSDPNVISGTSGQIALYACEDPMSPMYCSGAPQFNVLDWVGVVPGLNIDSAGTYTGTVYQAGGVQTYPTEVIITNVAPEPGSWVLVLLGLLSTMCLTMLSTARLKDE